MALEDLLKDIKSRTPTQTRPDPFTAWWAGVMLKAHAGEGLRAQIGRLEARVASLAEQLAERDEDVRSLKGVVLDAAAILGNDLSID
jgi:hypothetical protein